MTKSSTFLTRVGRMCCAPPHYHRTSCRRRECSTLRSKAAASPSRPSLRGCRLLSVIAAYRPRSETGSRKRYVRASKHSAVSGVKLSRFNERLCCGGDIERRHAPDSPQAVLHPQSCGRMMPGVLRLKSKTRLF